MILQLPAPSLLESGNQQAGRPQKLQGKWRILYQAAIESTSDPSRKMSLLVDQIQMNLFNKGGIKLGSPLETGQITKAELNWLYTLVYIKWIFKPFFENKNFPLNMIKRWTFFLHLFLYTYSTKTSSKNYTIGQWTSQRHLWWHVQKKTEKPPKPILKYILAKEPFQKDTPPPQICSHYRFDHLEVLFSDQQPSKLEVKSSNPNLCHQNPMASAIHPLRSGLQCMLDRRGSYDALHARGPRFKFPSSTDKPSSQVKCDVKDLSFRSPTAAPSWESSR